MNLPVMRRLRRPLGRRPTLGLTIVELMITLAVLAVVTGIAVPSMRTFTATQRTKALSSELMADLLMARSEALKRGTTVTVEPLGGNWAAGWTVTTDAQTVASRTGAAGAFSFQSAPTLISFNLHGRVASPTSAVRMTIRPAGQSTVVRCVELDLSGRARVLTEACA